MLKNKAILIHALVWAVMLTVLFFVSAREHPGETAVLILLYGALNMIIFYVHYFLVTPLFIGDNRYKRAILYVILVLLASIALKYAIALHYEDVILKYRDQENTEKLLTPVQYTVAALITGLFFMLLSTAAYIISANFKLREHRKSLENEKLNAELAFLKSQINPHFLFNSLNNIYSLAYQKSEKTPEAILKLSEIMRYMLYESNEEFVLLEEEINYLKNYIELQKLRFKEKVYVDLYVDVDEPGHRIMPLLLISFLENAFKHGVSTNASKPIRIDIEVHHGRLHFKAENAKSQLNKDQTKGVGLTNLKRRLQLGYPGRHTINIVESEDYYSSELFIYL
ncbi:histidine kinase [Parapedobacter sp. ISTM3]|uniref:Histidine kinase n=1 Tax=Parapedobacter luteus TaxID=623280 RepID=A0A1T5BM24_9SPHI|nr:MULTISPECIES: histidine kinase [Parapedobacter]MBK1439416.1 histidine kinase [Parapedobacter sp. ISTM3]SKB48314.1 Histidine kinase [Parapedobacter luteus]